MNNTCVYCIAFLTLVVLIFSLITLYGKNEDRRAEFDEYIKKHNKSYNSINNKFEYETRFQHFLASIEEIDALNQESHSPEEIRARYGLTALSDMSKEEFRQIHLSDEKVKKEKKLPRQNFNIGPTYDITRKKRANLPTKVDWRTKGIVGPVSNQGLCGACWAFSTIGIMEAMTAIQTGKLQQLSVQEAIDCAGFGNNGCSGGDVCLLLDWLLLSKVPITNATNYPLSLKEGTCRLKKDGAGVKVKQFTCDEFVGVEDNIIEMIADHGPVSVAVNAFTWQNYLGGIIQYHCSGDVADLNHAVQLVGYNLDEDVPYYIAKNSWGPEFGDEGYLKLSIGNNICGVANEVASVDVIV